MQLPIEWERRLEIWIEKLSRDIYTPVSDISWEGFLTDERLGYSRAMSEGDFSPVPNGTSLGSNWEYLWLRSQITVPKSVEGQKLVLQLEMSEASIYVDGVEFGCNRAEWVKDGLQRRSDLVLTECAVAGTVYEIAAEVYCGHDFPGTRFGPVLGGESAFSESDRKNRITIGNSSFGSWNELAFQLYIDAKFLRSAYYGIPGETLHRQDIFDALKDFTVSVDFEQDQEGRNASYLEARKKFAPILARHNGSTSPDFYAFGHAHIDVAWLWPLAETERKVHRTFATQIGHIERYPQYKFLQSQPHLYRMTKELYPNLYARIKKAVKNGQWIPEGGMWVEADTNITGGESLIRQFIHGKRFFKEEFGVDNELLWLPDVFGYSGALPQIMKGCGIKYFSTQKIFWIYNGGDPFPYQDFYWKGIDGSEIRTFLHIDYNSDINPQGMINRWKDRRQKYGLRGFMIPFGYGDGGGGPTREFIENAIRLEDFEGAPRMKMENPNRYFDAAPKPQDTYVGELFFQCHRGVQTSQAKIKSGNRECEIALRETEILGALAKREGYNYPLSQMDENWKGLLLCQFHDILPGTSIHRVYEDVYKIHNGIINSLQSFRDDMEKILCTDDGGISVFNSLSFDRNVIVPIPAQWQGAQSEGQLLPIQELDGSAVALVKVPAMGSVALYDAETPFDEKTALSVEITETGAIMDNCTMSIEFNARGEMVSAITKTGEVLKGMGNQFKMFKDIPVNYEAWDIDTNYELQPVELNENAKFEIVSVGEFAAALRISRKLNNSYMVQTVVMRGDTNRVDFITEIDWQETHKLLKVGFDVDITAREAISEIQFGHIARPNHRSRPFDLDRFEVPQHRWTALCEGNRGVAIINDSKYGVNTFGSCINLSLLRSPIAPDPTCDKGKQRFVYSFYPFDCPLSQSGVVREAYDLNCSATVFNGSRTRESAFVLSENNLFIDTLKPAEDGSDDIIVRLYEALGVRTSASLKINIPFGSVEACNMLEEPGEKVECEGKSVPLTFHPFEIKTLRIKR